MKIKKILVLLLFMVAIVGIIAPANAELYPVVGIKSLKAVENGKKTQLELFVQSDYSSSMKAKAELGTVNKLVVTVEGYNTITFKKPANGWKLYKNYYHGITKTFNIVGKPKNIVNKKHYSIKVYNKNGKLIKTGQGRLYSQY